ncbi:MAG: Peptide methionine sulfoxide reductase MsrA [Promethearchaeota archaeon]|nr:MAG: Peptide methionine sulfoxide reductase MsrA [Candidatus Lokiarchaeota archaeon]
MFGAGCFWGVEETFRTVEGVISTTVGYSGGWKENPTYKEVCKGDTGHTEVVQIIYDDEKISYEDLLDIFWKCHDPTQKNRQGWDIGYQYRSVIFYYDDEQKELAMESREKLDNSGSFSKPIATEIEPAKEYYKAEEYHQKYVLKNKNANCRVKL